MKRILTIIFVFFVLLNVTGCGPAHEQSSSNENNDFAVIPDIKIEEIDWNVGSGSSNGSNYVLLQYTNNSQYIINGFKLNFIEKSSLSEKEKEEFYSDIQKSQGFDDEYFNKWKESKEQLKEPITMYCNSSDELKSGETSEKIKCFYYGGWNSKNVLHSDLVTPEKAEIKYTKDDNTSIIYYNFDSKLYDVEKE